MKIGKREVLLFVIIAALIFILFSIIGLFYFTYVFGSPRISSQVIYNIANNMSNLVILFY